MDSGSHTEGHLEVWYWKITRVFLTEERPLALPEGWCFVPSGDPALTRRLKQTAEYWVVVRKRRNRKEGVGLCVPAPVFESVNARLLTERATEDPVMKQAAALRRRQHKQDKDTIEFRDAVRLYLNFHQHWKSLEAQLADAVTQHAIPIGSGTVARTRTIPIQERAEAAVIAWMRHNTSKYDEMYIPHMKGKRREVRHDINSISRDILRHYRTEPDFNNAACPLAIALRRCEPANNNNDGNNDGEHQ